MSAPVEVELDANGRQLLAHTEEGLSFAQYLPCSGGCGYLIGCGDAVEEAGHLSCLSTAHPRESASANPLTETLESDIGWGYDITAHYEDDGSKWWSWEIFDGATEEVLLTGVAVDDAETEIVRQIVREHNETHVVAASREGRSV